MSAPGGRWQEPLFPGLIVLRHHLVNSRVYRSAHFRRNVTRFDHYINFTVEGGANLLFILSRRQGLIRAPGGSDKVGKVQMLIRPLNVCAHVPRCSRPEALSPVAPLAGCNKAEAPSTSPDQMGEPGSKLALENK